MDWTGILGSAASLCSVCSFVPQAWKILSTRETKGISTRMYLLTVMGFTLWTSYGIALAAWPLIVANGICLVLSAAILAMKLFLRRSPKPRSA